MEALKECEPGALRRTHGEGNTRERCQASWFSIPQPPAASTAVTGQHESTSQFMFSRTAPASAALQCEKLLTRVPAAGELSGPHTGTRGTSS